MQELGQMAPSVLGMVKKFRVGKAPTQSPTPTKKMGRLLSSQVPERRKIPIIALLVATTDGCDALTSKQPCKKSWAVEAAIQQIAEGAGQRFATLT